MDFFEQLLMNYGVEETYAGYLSYGIKAILILLACFIVEFILKKIILKRMTRISKNNRFIWDSILMKHRVIARTVHLIPGILIYMAAPAFDTAEEVIQRSASTYILLVSVFLVSSVLDFINDVYRTKQISKVRPIKGLLQVVKIIVFIIIAIVTAANLMRESPLILLSGIGALAAVFSFVFKDSILGFIAGIQLTSNDMLRIGDWIEMSRYGADGEVIDITLNTIKVQNFEKTIVTIPAYALVSDSFKNWRGMLDFGGRRIKRSLNIDVDSISFCTPEMLAKFKKINYLAEYIKEKEKDIKTYNEKNMTDTAHLLNGRHMTNIGTFRAYIKAYLKNHPDINQDMAQVVRQLPPQDTGLPIEIYAFTTTTDWEKYEGIQADIFEHILSITGEFGLRIFQNPTGFDVKQISSSSLKSPRE